MGLDFNGTRGMLYAKTRGVDYAKSAMIGRQGLHLIPSEFRKNLVEFGVSFDEKTIDSIFNQNNGYAEGFLQSLGANDIHSFDNSAYEGATHIHNMNQAIPDDFKEQYSMVLDGGSLEHVFNFPVAIKNCMEMVKVGGHYIGITPANNFMGHGFYQFGPELYFSIFTMENGYELIDMIMFEDEKKTWYSVKSPMSIKHRVTLTNSTPVYILLIAKRVKRCSIFETFPQQSDYVSAWDQSTGSIDESYSQAAKKRKIITVIKNNMPQMLVPPIRRLIRCFSSDFDPRFFQRIEPASSRPKEALNRDS